jgi:hypothetical protein
MGWSANGAFFHSRPNRLNRSHVFIAMFDLHTMMPRAGDNEYIGSRCSNTGIPSGLGKRNCDVPHRVVNR